MNNRQYSFITQTRTCSLTWVWHWLYCVYSTDKFIQPPLPSWSDFYQWLFNVNALFSITQHSTLMVGSRSENKPSSGRDWDLGSILQQVLFVTVQTTQRSSCLRAGVLLLVGTPTHPTADGLLGRSTKSKIINNSTKYCRCKSLHILKRINHLNY